VHEAWHKREVLTRARGPTPLRAATEAEWIIARLGSFTHNISWRCGFLTQRLDTFLENV